MITACIKNSNCYFTFRPGILQADYPELFAKINDLRTKFRTMTAYSMRVYVNKSCHGQNEDFSWSGVLGIDSEIEFGCDLKPWICCVAFTVAHSVDHIAEQILGEVVSAFAFCRMHSG